MDLLQYLLTITIIIFSQLLIFVAIPFTILLTTISLFGAWPHQLQIVPVPRAQAHSSSSNQTTTDTSSHPNPPSSSERTTSSQTKGSPPPSSSTTTPTPSTPGWSTPARVRGTAFALSLLRLWYTGELRALSQFMFTANVLVAVGYGGLWVWYRSDSSQR